MKNLILTLSLALSFVFFVACDSSTTNENTENHETEKVETSKLSETSFRVFGNCGMCKDRIEKASKNIDGVETAQWNEETEILKISHKSNVKIHDVHKAIAAVGHDTEMHKADDEVYSSLPECCKYER